MTTAHKPTWVPAMGKESGANMSVPTRSYSSRDLPGHLFLKERQEGQQSKQDLKYKDFKAELLEKEKKYFREKKERQGIYEADPDNSTSGALTAGFKEPMLKKKLKSDDNSQIQKQLQGYGSDEEEKTKTNKPLGDLLGKAIESDSEESEKDVQESNNDKKADKEVESINPFPQDADDLDFANTSSDDEPQKEDSDNSEKTSSESDSDDDEELLMREYQKIKEEREAAEKESLKQKDEEIEKQRQQNLLKHNPLLDQEGQYSLKRKWFEDTVFKNQSKKNKEEKVRFINDNVRSDFHKKFLKKFIYT